MKKSAQATIEFTFAVVVVMFLIYGMVRVFRWAGMDLANRRVTQDLSLSAPVQITTQNPTADPAVQLSTGDSSDVMPIAAVYHGNVTNGNETQ